MKQVLLSGKGQVHLFDVPIPALIEDSILVRNAYSMISSGTEGAAVASRKNWVGVAEKLIRSPERITRSWKLAKSHGMQHALNAIRVKLENYGTLGYSCAGTVVEVASTNTGFSPGDRVACMGSGWANHAEYVVVPKNLAVIAPPAIALEEAAFAALGCIALQGIRRLGLSPGEYVGVIGLGLIGRLTLRLLSSMGYQACGLDIRPERVGVARDVDGVQAWLISRVGLHDPIHNLTKGVGLDGVIICAATRSNDPMEIAFDLLRYRGRVSVVGDVGLKLSRERMYQKELEVRMSCSYGPGRHDPDYEIKGQDYPVGLVRWTERRNLEYLMEVLSSGQLELRSLISAQYPIQEAQEAYSRVKQGEARDYGILLEYSAPTVEIPRGRLLKTASVRRLSKPGCIRVALIGAGSYVQSVHLPNLKQLANLFEIVGVASRSGVTASNVGRKVEASTITSDYRCLLEDASIDAVIIATRHSSHAALILDALSAGKHVFVEKPMATTIEDARQINELVNNSGLVLRVGFNRRFSPYLLALREVVGDSGRRILSVRVNVGSLDGHWSNSAGEGGRLLGEGVHFFDVCNWLINVPLVGVSVTFAGEIVDTNPNASVQLRYADGSLGQVLYTVLGNKQCGKEHYEVFGNGKSARSMDFTTFSAYGSTVSVPRRERGNKGQRAELVEFAACIRGEPYPVRGADAADGLLATWIASVAPQSAVKGVTIKCEIAQ